MGEIESSRRTSLSGLSPLSVLIIIFQHLLPCRCAACSALRAPSPLDLSCNMTVVDNRGPYSRFLKMVAPSQTRYN